VLGIDRKSGGDVGLRPEERQPALVGLRSVVAVLGGPPYRRVRPPGPVAVLGLEDEDVGVGDGEAH
jgi:hypothetical protein